RLYAGHPYALPALGRATSVQRVDREALVARHRRFYRAPRMVLSISGDVQAPDVRKAVTTLFAEAPAGDATVEGGAPPAPVPAGDRRAVIHPSAQSQILMGFLAPPIGHHDYAAMQVLTAALGGGMGGRLFAELRDKEGLAYSTGASYPSRVGPSYLLAQMGTAPANAARAEEGMRREIERISDAGVSASELERAKTYLLGQFSLDRRTNARLAWYAAFFECAGVGHDYYRRYVRAVEAVSQADVQRVAGRYLGSRTVVSLGPAAR